jgi:serine/threonine protein kinase
MSVAQSEAQTSVMICPSCRAKNDDGAEACFICGRALTALTHGALIANRYEVQKPIGRGGMGMVYRAHDKMLDEIVALKVLRAELAGTSEAAQRFRSEIKLARKVSHRNVCRIYEYGEDAGVRYISMEYVEGTDLKQILRDSGLTVDEAFEVCIQTADGLQAIHDVGIIHRDMKTPNIMLLRDAQQRPVVRLMDFGIAKVEGSSTASGLTTTGQIMGTPEYMSPELCMGEKIDHRSDVYAAGIVTYEIFMGQVPYKGDSAVATLFKHIQDPVPPDDAAAERMPPSLVPVIRHALAKNRDARFASAHDLAAALREAHREFKANPASDAPRTSPVPASPTAPTAPPPERRRDTRLDIFANFKLRRLDDQGDVLQEERTIAENVGRGGARVCTSMASLGAGDVVTIEEVGGPNKDKPFTTRAEVRHSYLGKDNIRRLNLRFLDRPAPKHLVVEEDARTSRR